MGTLLICLRFGFEECERECECECECLSETGLVV